MYNTGSLGHRNFVFDCADIWDQIKNAKVIKNDLSEQWIKIALRAFTFNYIDVDEKQIGIDGKQLKLLKKVRKKTTILKPDKGQGLLLSNHKDYTNCVEMFVTWSKYVYAYR